MKHLVIIGFCAAALAGCQTDSQTERVLGLGAVGAATGAVIGGVASGDAEGALIGAALGGAGGALIGGAVSDSEQRGERRRYRQPRDRYCQDYDEYGEPITVRC
jgi:uncharacterized protein YcfJ